MNRLLWATISGLLLGAVLFGMLQRGCDATGAVEDDTQASRRSAEFISGAPVRRSQERSDPFRAESPDFSTSSATRRTQTFDGQASREAMQERARSRAQALAEARRAQREAARDRSIAQREAPSRALSPPAARTPREFPTRGVTASSPRQTRGQRADTGEVGIGGEVAGDGDGAGRGVSMEEADAARRTFQSTLGGREFSAASQANDDGRRGSGGLGGVAESTDTPRGADSAERQQPFNQPVATAGFGRAPTFPGGGDGDDGAIPPPPGGEPAPSPSPPPPPPPSEGTGTERGDLGVGGDDGPPAPSAPAVMAHWIPAPVEDSPCPELSQFRTNDLFLSFRDPSLVLVVTSDPALGGLRVTGGSFYQDATPFGSNAPPQNAVVQFSPCVARDSFLTLGGQAPSFPPGAEPDPRDWGQTLNATWFTLDGAVGQIDPSRFGDDRFYVWIGRVTAGGPNLSVSGALLVNSINLLTGSNSAEFVPLFDCSSCWEGAVGVLPDGAISELELSPSMIAGGAGGVGAVRLSEPASIGGVRVSLSSDRPDIVSIPGSITIAAGESEATFSYSTEMVGTAQLAQITASSGQTTARATLEVVPLGIASITFNPGTTPQGRPVTGTVRLTGAAPSSGVRIDLVSQNEVVVPTPAGKLTIEPGRSSGTFTVTPGIVRSPTTVGFIAFLESDSTIFATGSFTVLPVIGDLTGNGLVGPEDQAILLSNWGPCPPSPQPCVGDLNGDGFVGSLDLAILLGSWTHSPPDDSGGPDPEDPPSLTARWVPIDNSGCHLLGNHRTGDLYLGFGEAGRVVLVESNEVDGIRIENGSFFQNNPGGNGPPPPDLADDPDLPPEFVCWLFDSYLTIEGVRPPSSVNFAVAPPPNNWGSTLVAAWFVFAGGAGAEARHDPAFFGDNRHYVRIGRFTAEDAATVFGAVTAFFQPDSTGVVGAVRFEVPDWSLARGSLDINNDGVVDSGDLGSLMRMLGTSNPAGDLNGDGVVSMEDVRIFIDTVGSSGQ